jgi:tryptophan 2,3-dioxygenase
MIKNSIYYSDYLQLDKLINSQNPKSNEHDEMLFIVIHQVYELWFKQILYELDSIIDIFKREYIDEKLLLKIVSRLGRIIEIQKIMIEQFKVIETMTPADFLEFRDYLFPASGFQSFQFRLLENKLGLKFKNRVNYGDKKYQNVLSQEHQDIINKSENDVTLLELLQKWLERTPFLKSDNFDFLKYYKISVEKILKNDEKLILNHPNFSENDKIKELNQLNITRKNFESIFDEKVYNKFLDEGIYKISYKSFISALFIVLYRDEPILNLPFMIINSLIDIDELFSTWRYKHSLLAYRMLGKKIGTGGSSGYEYLKSTVEAHKIFTDFFNLSTFLIPKSMLPELPDEILSKLRFYYNK